MKALVVYDSVFGNTEQIANAIGNALGSGNDVGILRVNDVKPEHLAGLELLIVGSPTRAFRPTPAITTFLKNISVDSLKDVKVAAFDTGISMNDTNSRVLRFLVKSFGYAAKHIADRLEKKGGRLLAAPEGFFVTGTEGPLKEGEFERAAAWVKQILSKK